MSDAPLNRADDPLLAFAYWWVSETLPAWVKVDRDAMAQDVVKRYRDHESAVGRYRKDKADLALLLTPLPPDVLVCSGCGEPIDEDEIDDRHSLGEREYHPECCPKCFPICNSEPALNRADDPSEPDYLMCEYCGGLIEGPELAIHVSAGSSHFHAECDPDKED